MPPMRALASLPRAALTALLLSLAACGSGAGAAPAPSPPPDPGGPTLGQVAPEFALVDVNPASPSTATEVAPSDSLGRVSVWYFGHAT
jgi:hypothetical protein